MNILAPGPAVYCDTGEHEGKYRVQAIVYLSDEELAQLQHNYGAEFTLTLEED